jgi:hypothetical protein
MNSEIILGFYFYQKRSFLTDLRSITWFFKTSFKTTYFNTVFRLFLGRYHSKKILKQHFSTKLDKGYRLVYELSYLVEKQPFFFETPLDIFESPIGQKNIFFRNIQVILTGIVLTLYIFGTLIWILGKVKEGKMYLYLMKVEIGCHKKTKIILALKVLQSHFSYVNPN